MERQGYTFYPKDFISDPEVMMMTSSERGIYRDLIDLAYMSDNKIKYNLFQLSKYCNATEQEIENILKIKGKKEGDFWTIPSCNKRIAKANVNRVNGGKGGRPQKPKVNPSDNPTPNPKETQTESPRERESERESKSEEEREDKKPKLSPPSSFDEFFEYAKEKKPRVCKSTLRLKYESWVENDWHKEVKGKSVKILNWKSTLLNTLPYIKETEYKPTGQITL